MLKLPTLSPAVALLGSSGNRNRFGSIAAWDEWTEWQWRTSSSTPACYLF